MVWIAEPNKFLVAKTARLAAGAALDLGAGEGRNLVWLAQPGSRMTAVDSSDVSLASVARLAAATGAEMATVCTDAADGTPLVVGHDTTNTTSGHGGPYDPDVLFVPDDVTTDIAEAGLVIERAERVQRTAALPAGERIAVDALLRARRPTQP